MTTPVYDVDYFLAKFEAIPEDKWTTGGFKVGKKRCALGHCGRFATIEGLRDSKKAKALCDLFDKGQIALVYTNDNITTEFPQETPRARILAALHEIKGG